jgi:ABC-type proline/glycine betaine transport system permease subunit
MKILFAFGLAQTYSAVFSVVVISFLWAALIGIGLSIVRGRAKILAKNTYKILTAQPRDESSFQKIPYSVALFLAWITYILMGLQQGAF